MYAPPYGYSAPGSYGGYPGPINTLTPGQPYAPGGTISPGPTYAPGGTVPYNGGTIPGGANPYGGNAPYYSPPTSPGNNSAVRPTPTYADPNAGGNELGYNEGRVLQRASGLNVVSEPMSIPNAAAAPINNAASPQFETPTARGVSEWDDDLDGETTFNKLALPQLPPAATPVSSGTSRWPQSPAF
ncbi:MAG: hypothetical protein KF774_03070 [Planctomyces sp.]|nr:hypothetical protein [Planctomyces sp.]